MLGIYTHFPLCEKRCSYCDFNTYAFPEMAEAYTKALVKNIPLLTREFDLTGKTAGTIYFGGGTPSIFTEQQLEKIIHAIENCFTIKKNAEFTIEANPQSLSKSKISFYKSIGINRISIGVQSFNDNILKYIGRMHDSKMAIKSIDLARSLFENISIDLIFGLPNQSLNDWKKDLNFFLFQKIPHLSTYLLSVNNYTASWKNKISSDDELLKFFKTTKNILEKNNNIRQYEISNFAKNGFECQHNIKYWTNVPYISFGSGAHSFIGQRNNFIRFESQRNLKKFIKRANEGTLSFSMKETLSEWERKFDFITTALRMNTGFSTKKYCDIFKSSFEEEFSKIILRNISSGNLKIEGDRFSLTDRGKLLSNLVFSDFYAVLHK